MTTIDPVSNLGDAGTKTESSPTVDYEAFLRLLVAQMKNQDPTNPTDSAEFLSQLASFSSVEQAVQTNSKLDALLSQNSVLQAGALIGRSVESAQHGQSGVVTAVAVEGGVIKAVLENGAEIPINNGVLIR